MKKNKIVILLGVIVLLILTSIPVTLLFNRNGTEKYDVVYFGDSIIAGTHSENEIPDLVSDITGMRVLNAAFGGTSMTDTNVDHYSTSESLFFSMAGLSEAIRDNDFTLVYSTARKTTDYEIDYWESVAWSLIQVDWKSVRYIIIEHGVNDYLAGMPMEDYSNAIREIVSNINKGAPQAKILFTTPIYCYPRGFEGDCNTVDLGGGLLEAYVTTQRDTALECGASSIDNYNEIDINIDNFESYLADGLHPNDIGKRMIAENVSKYLKEYEDN